MKAEKEIHSVCFTEDNHFVLVCITGIKKPAQLCIGSHISGCSERECLEQLKQEECVYGKELRMMEEA